MSYLMEARPRPLHFDAAGRGSPHSVTVITVHADNAAELGVTTDGVDGRIESRTDTNPPGGRKRPASAARSGRTVAFTRQWHLAGLTEVMPWSPTSGLSGSTAYEGRQR